MSQKYGPFGLSYNDEVKRLHNYDLCRQFLELKGPNRNVDRMPITTETGAMILTFCDGDIPPREAPTIGISFHELGELTLAGKFQDKWPDWILTNGFIYTTPDPDIMYIECDGQSVLYDPACKGELGYYLNHYILVMNFVDGKIDDVEEIYNPAAVYNNYGWHKEPSMY